MRSNFVKTAAVALAVLAIVVAVLTFRRKDKLPSPENGSRPSITAERRSGLEGASRVRLPSGQGQGSRSPGDSLQSAGFGKAEVQVELEPDMAYFLGSGGGVEDAILEDLKAGKLLGNELVAALSALRGMDLEELPIDVGSFLSSQDDQVRRAALAVLAGAGPEGLGKAWDAVKDGQDPLSMLAVMKVAAAKGGPGLGPILKDGIGAAHPQIRFDAMEMVEPLQGKDERARREVLRAAASSEHADVATMAEGQLSYDPRKADVVILFDLLDHPDEEVSASARGSLEFLIDVELESAEQARTWWEAHARDFDDDLNPVE